MTKVLVVDDDHAVRAALAITLSDMGLAVSEAVAGLAAEGQGVLEVSRRLAKVAHGLCQQA